MATVYLSGPIDGATDNEIFGWRREATAALNNAGIETLDPTRSFHLYRGKEEESYAKIVASDLDDIGRSDYVLAMARKPSFGTAMEIRAAHAEYRKKVVLFKTAPVPGMFMFQSHNRWNAWLLAHSRYRCQLLADAIRWIVEDVRSLEKLAKTSATGMV